MSSRGGFNEGEVRCGCGATFGSTDALIEHARDDHGIDVW